MLQQEIESENFEGKPKEEQKVKIIGNMVYTYNKNQNIDVSKKSSDVRKHMVNINNKNQRTFLMKGDFELKNPMPEKTKTEESNLEDAKPEESNLEDAKPEESNLEDAKPEESLLDDSKSESSKSDEYIFEEFEINVKSEEIDQPKKLKTRKRIAKIHKCIKCEKSFKNKIYLRKHMKEFHKKKLNIKKRRKAKQPFSCGNSQNIKIGLDSLKNEICFMCDQCEYSTKHSANVKIHQEVKHEKRRYRCIPCNVTTSFKQHLQKHLREKHDGKTLYFCSECDHASETKQDYVLHKKCHFEGRVKSCEFSTATQEELIRHIQEEHEVHVPVKKGLPEHKFITNVKLPTLFIDGFVLRLNKYRNSTQGQKVAYFYCINMKTRKCRVSGRAVVNSKPDNNEQGKLDEITGEVGDYLYPTAEFRSPMSHSEISNSEEINLHTNKCMQIAPDKFMERKPESAKNRSMKCDLCENDFDSNDSFYTHREEEHGLNKYSCKHCDFETKLYKQFKDHTRKQHEGRVHPCLDCGFIFLASKHLKSHTDSVHKGITYPCEIYGKRYKQSYMLKIHIDTDHNGIVNQCNHCPYFSKQKGHLKDHIKTIHFGQLHKCDVCGNEYTHRSALKDHKNRGHDLEGNELNKRGIRRIKNYDTSKHTSKHTCELSNTTGKPVPETTEKEIEISEESNDKESSISEENNDMEEGGFIVETLFSREINKQISCQTPKEQFTKNENLDTETKRKEDQCLQCAEEKKETMIEKKDDMWHCKECGKNVKTKSNINYHVETHIQINVNCDVCERSYESLAALKTHRMRGHKPSGKIKVLDANEEEKKIALNTKKEALIEKKNNVWHCKECGRTAKQITDIKNHVESHIEGISKKCNICDKSYRSYTVLRSHRLRDHRSQIRKKETEKKHKCDVCGKYYKSRIVVLSHKSRDHRKTELDNNVN